MHTEKDEIAEDSSDEVIKLARERFAMAEEAESEIRTLALDDLKFAAGDQWDARAKEQRDREGRPCLVVNRLPQALRQVQNDQRQNRPAIKISPVDDKSDVETAKVLQGMVRHIEYSSNADTAYDTAFAHSTGGGFGGWYVDTEYCDPFSFHQDIRIKRIPDPFSFYLDPNYTEPDGSDANWGFLFTDYSSDAFKAKWPDAKLTGEGDWETLNSSSKGWVKKDSVRVANYYTKEFRKARIFQLTDGTVVEEDKLEEGMMLAVGEDGEPVSRESLIPEIKAYKLNGHEVLEKTDWLGCWIPIVPCIGEEQIIEGKRRLISLVRHAKAPQQMLNVWKSYETEAIMMAPKSPWIVDFSTIKGFERFWDTANQRNHAYLPFDGKKGAPPNRISFEPAVQAITQASMFAADDIKATTGVYDAAMGARSNENSGIAIQRRANQAQVSNFHFIDNLSKSIRHTGRILVDLIPHIYDTERAVRILGEDGSEEVVWINKLFDHKGKQTEFKLGAGKYDVTVATGPSYETKRQEAVATMSELVRAYPQFMPVAGDLLVKAMDLPNAQELSDRLKKMLPPELQEQQGQPPIPPAIQAQMQQMQQLIEQLTQAANSAHDELDKKKLELESKERMLAMELETKAAIEYAKLQSNEAIEMLAHQIAELDVRQRQVHESHRLQAEMQQAPGMPAPMSEEQQQAPNQMQEQEPTGGFSPGMTPLEDLDNGY